MDSTSLMNSIVNQEPLFGLSFTSIIIVLAAVLILQGLALWKAAENRSKGWFWALFLLNTMGILPALYLFVFSRRKR
jgi:hypothetical protein